LTALFLVVIGSAGLEFYISGLIFCYQDVYLLVVYLNNSSGDFIPFSVNMTLFILELLGFLLADMVLVYFGFVAFLCGDE